MPEISVVMSVHNGEATVGEAIQSILNQSYRNFEFVIIDNGSTDKTWNIIDQYRKDRRIFAIKCNVMQTLSQALNDGIGFARGKYIARMDADDMSYPDRLKRQYEYMERHPEIGVLGTYYDEVGKDGKRVPRKQNPTDPEKITRALYRFNPVAHSTALIRSSTLSKIKRPYEGRYKYAQDYDLWVKLSKVTSLKNLPEVHLKRRFTPDYGKMNEQLEEEQMIKEWYFLIKERSWKGIYEILRSYFIYYLVPLRLREALRRWFHR